MKTLRIASRRSPLALRQAELVQHQLQTVCGLSSQIIPLTSAGDQLHDTPLHDFGGKGLFVRAIETALLNGKADLAVHSLKDMPVQETAGLSYACFLPRQTAEDVLIVSKQHPLAKQLPARLNLSAVTVLPTLRIATGSLRRKFLLQHANPALIVIPLRGNVDTRLKALHAGKYDALVSARAALQRLRLHEHDHIFDHNWYVPSCGQGVIAVQTLTDCAWSKELAKLDCQATRQCVEIERAIVKALGGNCALPFGCHAQVVADNIQVNALAMSAKLTARVSFTVARDTNAVTAAARAMQEFSHTQLATVLAQITGRF